MTCIICQQVDVYKVIQDYNICFSCFHISKYTNANASIKNDKNVDKSYSGIFLEYLFRELEDLIKSKCKINVVSVDGPDTSLLDLIKSRFGENVKTTSISEKFNPSYFSRHKCHKLSLDMYVNIDNYDTFDFIILNNSLDYTSDPISLLKRCKMICNNDGCIYSTKLHVSILLSSDYINMKKNTMQIWSTHSVKKLCQYSGMLLSDVFKGPNTRTRIYKILHCKDTDDQLTKPIVEDLYDEICHGFYNIAPYHYIKHFWSMYIEICNTTFDKYVDHNYKIIGIHQDENTYNLLNISVYINENEINENLENRYKNDKVVFVILNYPNYKYIYDKLDKCLKSRHHLIFDLYNLIVV